MQKDLAASLKMNPPPLSLCVCVCFVWTDEHKLLQRLEEDFGFPLWMAVSHLICMLELNLCSWQAVVGLFVCLFWYVCVSVCGLLCFIRKKNTQSVSKIHSLTLRYLRVKLLTKCWRIIHNKKFTWMSEQPYFSNYLLYVYAKAFK